MPRKSVSDVLTERHGGKWTFDRKTSDRWHDLDGRVVVREKKCMCWAIPDRKGPCRCPVSYVMHDQDGNKEVVDLSDPRIYRLNGASTYR